MQDRRGQDGAIEWTFDARTSNWGNVFAEVWLYRELLLFMVWRDVKVRYAQTQIGIVWCIIQPLLSTAVFSLVFGALAHIPSGGVPYALSAFIGLLPWTYFSLALAGATSSVTQDASLVSKIYFPRVLLPLAACSSALLDFSIVFVVAFLVAALSGYPPDFRLVVALPALLLSFGSALGAGLLLGALNVRFRDVKHAIPFLLQVWFFATPIVYSTSIVPDQYRVFFALNPMVTAVEGVRYALLGHASLTAVMIAVSAMTAAILLAMGYAYFHRSERAFADVI